MEKRDPESRSQFSRSVPRTSERSISPNPAPWTLGAFKQGPAT